MPEGVKPNLLIPPGDSTGVLLFVADTGCGIPADSTEKIFDRFYKIDSFKQEAGLGLSVCKTIIEGIGGRITVSSQPGKGSRFTVKIPIKQAGSFSGTKEPGR